METHVREENASSIIQSVVPGWRFDENYQHSERGRIWVVWDPSVSLIVYKRSAQAITCGVFDRASNVLFIVVFVYALNTAIQKRDLWTEIEDTCNLPVVKNLPTLVLGDFNQILTADEHYSINPFTLPVRGMEEFQECLSRSDLVDLEARGTHFTWGNGGPEDPILRKLDRVLGNEKWRDQFPEVYAPLTVPVTPTIPLVWLI